MTKTVCVPVEPTEAMLNAGWSVSNHDIGDGEMSLIWSAMLAASTPVGGCGHTPGYRNGPHKTCSLCGQTHWSPEMPSSAPPPPSVSIDNGSRPQEAVPSEQAALPVLALLDQISALCTAFNDQIHDAEDTLGQINQLAYAGIAALRPDTVRKGIGDLAVIDLQTIRMWLEGLADCTDMNEVCADGGVTVGMAYQQDAREFSARIARMLPTTPQPADGCSSNEGADGWIEHDGGPNPVPGQRVDVRWRDGEVSTDEPSRDWCWKPTDGDDTIIAYRIAGSAHD